MRPSTVIASRRMTFFFADAEAAVLRAEVRLAGGALDEGSAAAVPSQSTEASDTPRSMGRLSSSRRALP